MSSRLYMTDGVPCLLHVHLPSEYSQQPWRAGSLFFSLMCDRRKRVQLAYLHNATNQHMYVAKHSLVAKVLTGSIRMVHLVLSFLTNSIAVVASYKAYRCRSVILAYVYNVFNQCIFAYVKNRGQVATSQSKFKFEKARETATCRPDCTRHMTFRPACTYISFAIFTTTMGSEAPVLQFNV
jgi:hypothetical protein